MVDVILNEEREVIALERFDVVITPRDSGLLPLVLADTRVFLNDSMQKANQSS